MLDRSSEPLPNVLQRKPCMVFHHEALQTLRTLKPFPLDYSDGSLAPDLDSKSQWKSSPVGVPVGLFRRYRLHNFLYTRTPQRHGRPDKQATLPRTTAALYSWRNRPDQCPPEAPARRSPPLQETMGERWERHKRSCPNHPAMASRKEPPKCSLQASKIYRASPTT